MFFGGFGGPGGPGDVTDRTRLVEISPGTYFQIFSTTLGFRNELIQQDKIEPGPDKLTFSPDKLVSNFSSRGDPVYISAGYARFVDRIRSLAGYARERIRRKKKVRIFLFGPE